MNSFKMASRIASRMVVANGGYGLSSEGFDLAEASPFVDTSNLGLGLALACEIAARAENIVEDGGTYQAQLTDTYLPNKYADLRFEKIKAEGGYRALSEDLLTHPKLKRVWDKKTKHHPYQQLEDFLEGRQPANWKDEKVVDHYLTWTYESAPKPFLLETLRDPAAAAVGILRDLGVDLSDNQIQIKLVSTESQDPTRLSIYLDGQPFYETDWALTLPKSLTPVASQVSESFLIAKGTSKFIKPNIKTQSTEEASSQLQALYACLTHPVESVRLQAEEWVRSPDFFQNMFRKAIASRMADANTKAVARGWLKRIVKRFDEANFHVKEDDVRDFFGKDIQMLLAKCWNKSGFSTFGAFDLEKRYVEPLILYTIGRRIQPAFRTVDEVKKYKPEALTDIVMVAMIDCALRKMGVTPPYSKISSWIDRIG